MTQSTDGASFRVLVADDDGDMRALLVDTLVEEGFVVLEAHNGLELVERLGLQDPMPSYGFDVVVSDVRMPGLTGLEVLEGLHELDVEAAVILISAFADQDTHDTARRLGARAVLAKPFGLDTFVETVRAAAETGRRLTGQRSP